MFFEICLLASAGNSWNFKIYWSMKHYKQLNQGAIIFTQKIETEATKTYNTSFLSLKRPDFKYVIFKIVEVSPRNPPAKQHSRFGPIPPNVGRIGCAA